MTSLITGLDHVVVLVEDLAAAIKTYGALLGLTPAWHSRADGSLSAFFTFANMSIELLAADGDSAAADRVRAARAAQGGDGLASLCFRVADITRMHRRLERLALQPEPISPVESIDTVTGVTLRWQRTRVSKEAGHGVRLFFVQMDDERPRPGAVADNPVLGLDHVVIASGHPDRAASLYGARLGLDMALDRSHPDWGRLLFFRCGDLVVEVVQRPGHDDPPADRLWGLSWRVADLNATHDRLIAAGIAVSAVRAGRKPGTRVMSVRSPICGVNTLFLERAVGRPN